MGFVPFRKFRVEIRFREVVDHEFDGPVFAKPSVKYVMTQADAE